MTHVSLDDQLPAVRELCLNLPPGPDDSVVEFGGRPVARVLPAPTLANAMADAPPWPPELNRRRCVLIDRKYAQGLTAAEHDELAGLQVAMHQFIDAVAPLPIECGRKLHRELMEKAARAGTGA